MPGPKFVELSLLAAVVVAVVASAVLLRPTGAQIGSDGDSGIDREATVALDPVEHLEIRDVTLTGRGDFRDSRADRRSEPPSERHGKRTASSPPVGEHDDVGEYVDPDAYPVSPFGSGIPDDVGEFQDPDYDLLAPLPNGGSEVGDYLEPEEGP